MKKVMFIMAAALLMMTQCKKENETPTDPAEGTVKMTVTAGSGAKTDISTATGAITWSEGDKLYVSKNGSWLGCLELLSGENTANGTFTGNVTGIGDGDTPCHFFYLGNSGMTEPTGTAAVSISLASQDGTLAGAMKYHIGYGRTDVTVTEGEATGYVEMKTKIAIAHINFTTDGTTAYTGSVTMGGTGISNTLTVSPDGSFSGSGTDGITIGGTTGERYVTLIPTGTTDVLSVAFTGDATGGMTFANGIEANKFYGMKDAIAVTLEAEYVDFGLPSGTLWATCNVGASKPEEYGWYFMWGSVTEGGDSDCLWRNCPGNVGNTYDATAFNTWKSLNLTDNVLNPGVDAASVNRGGDWRMPTIAEFEELYNNTVCTWTTENGVNGCKFVSKTDAAKYIFLPAASYREGLSVWWAGSYGRYWLSSLDSSDPSCAYRMRFNSGPVSQQNSDWRYYGCTVRPVRPAR